jgi:hypothetical protein
MEDVTLSERAIGEAGLAEAYQRLSERIADPAMGEPLLSLAETLEWCYSLEEHLRHDPGRAGTYFLTRDQDPDGQTLAGLIYARGLFTHSLIASVHLVDLAGPSTRLKLSGGRGGGVTHASGLVSFYLWKPLAELPPPPPERQEKHNRYTFYERHVERRPVMDPLATAKRFLLGLP